MPQDRFQHWAVCLVLVASTLVVYGRTYQFDFLNFDDDVYVTDNAAVREGLTTDGVRWAFTTSRAQNWHPVTWLSHMLDVELFGLNAGAHHLVNVVLHLCNTLLLYAFLVTATRAQWPSAFVAALFALHPCHVESVAWVSERKDVLSTLFWMLTLLAYVRYARRPGPGRYVLALSLFAVGLLAKQMLVTLPLVLFLLDFWPLNRWAGRALGEARRLVLEKVPLVVLAVAAGSATVAVQPIITLDRLPLVSRLVNAVISTVRYIYMMFWPLDLAIFYPFRSPSLWVGGIAAVAILAVTVFALKTSRRAPYVAVGWFWYLITLAPVIGVVQVGTQRFADRYTYIPYIGLFIVVAWGGATLLREGRRRTLILATTAGGVLLALIAATGSQVGHWRNNLTVFEHALAVTESNYMAHNNLGQELERRGQLAEAGRHYAAAVRIHPGFPPAQNNLGVALAKRGDYRTAETHFREALRMQPDFAVAQYNLGLVLENQGDFPASIEHYTEAVRLKPDYVEAHFALADSLEYVGRIADAERHYREVLRLRPNAGNARAGLERVLAAMGQQDPADRAHEQVESPGAGRP